MRVLAMAAPGSGMFLPTIPLAWALRAAGHEVLIANNGESVKAIVRAGFSAVDVCPDRDVFNDFLDASVAINTTPAGQPRPKRGGLGLFGEEMAEGLLTLAKDFRPDVVLATLEQGAGPLIASALHVPHVEQSIRLAWAGSEAQARHYRNAIAEYMEPTRIRLGLPQPTVEQTTVIDVRPPSMGGVTTATQWLMRYVPYNESRLIPAWVVTKPLLPRICVTMGSGLPASVVLDGLKGLLAELADLDVELVLALGEIDMSSIGPLPDNVRHVGWMPLSAILPSCAAIAHHGGSGTSLTSLAYGVPQIVIPRNADQPANGAVLARRGVGICYDLANVTPEELQIGLRRLLTESSFRDSAAEVQNEIAAQPSPADIVARIEDLLK